MDPEGSYDVGGVDSVKNNFISVFGNISDDHLHFVEGYFKVEW